MYENMREIKLIKRISNAEKCNLNPSETTFLCITYAYLLLEIKIKSKGTHRWNIMPTSNDVITNITKGALMWIFSLLVL